MIRAFVRGGLPMLLVLVASPAAAQRAEVPIAATVFANGATRYSVTIAVGGRTIDAALDTGSTGLRIVAAAVPPGGSTGAPVRARFSAGVELVGPLVTLPLGIGNIAPAKVRFARIDHITCVQRSPDCPAPDADAAAFRIMSDGVPGQGFVAILGIGMGTGTVDNPLVQLGIRRWIVELPRPGESAPGRLILNPDDRDVARFVSVAMFPNSNTLRGCIVAADQSRKVCAPADLDTGAIGIRVRGGKDDDVLPAGTRATIVVGDARNTIELPIEIGRRDRMTQMRAYPPRGDGKLALTLGVAPYLAWSVLYDWSAHRIGFAARTN